jgi:hypothetical protein
MDQTYWFSPFVVRSSLESKTLAAHCRQGLRILPRTEYAANILFLNLPIQVGFQPRNKDYSESSGDPSFAHISAVSF